MKIDGTDVPGRRASIRRFGRGGSGTRNRWLTLLRRGMIVVLSLHAFDLAASAQGSKSPTTTDIAAHTNVLVVEVRVWKSEEPLEGAVVRLPELRRQQLTGDQGLARFDALAPRNWAVTVERMGYRMDSTRVDVSAAGPTRLRVDLREAPVLMEPVDITGRRGRGGSGLAYRPATLLAGDKLESNLGSSIPQTLSGVPGFALQYNGPGAARPSIRGMSGDRVLMLEDGHRTGDLHQTAADHGVMVEPLNVRRVEVVRGPAGLMHGANAMGGVVNVVRDDIPRSQPARTAITATSQLESVNAGTGGGIVGEVPAGPFAFRGEVSGRRHRDTRTPQGTLRQTAMRTADVALGGAWTPAGGSAGIAFRRYSNRYGVPGEFQGQLIPGGHTGGVEIDAVRTTGRFRAARESTRIDGLDGLEADASITRYRHDELEGLIDGRAVVGTQFRQTSVDINLMGYYTRERHRFPVEGAAGIAAYGRDLVAGGSSPGSRSGTERAVAGFAYQEVHLSDAARIQAGFRYDYREVVPATMDSLRVRTRHRTIVKPVASRTFGAVSASVSALRDVGSGWTLGVGVTRAHRAPTIEELYSDGPHLADFSFDIGNPALEAETGWGVDLILRAKRPRLHLEWTGFVNRMDGYIQYSQTGETIRVFREGARPRVTPVYEARGDDALFLGCEGEVHYALLPELWIDADVAWIRAERRRDRDPLPFIPPLTGRISLRWDGTAFSAWLGTDMASSQRRVPAPVGIGEIQESPQSATARYALLNLGLGWQGFSGPVHHRVSLRVNNLTHRTWHDHLSRIKEVAPQPGRNVQLTWRVHY